MRISDSKVFPIFDKYEKFLEESDEYILIPDLISSEFDPDDHYITHKDMKIVEKWCRSRNILYCYKVMSPSMPLH